LNHSERARVVRAATTARRLRIERLQLRRIEIEARRQLAADIAGHQDRLRLGLVPRRYKPDEPLEW
jgi:hypothetical protein